MTQRELAAQVGVNFHQIQNYETGHNRLSASRMWRIANVLKIDVRRFYDGLATPPIDDWTPSAGGDPLGLAHRASRLPVGRQRLVFEVVREMAGIRPPRRADQPREVPLMKCRSPSRAEATSTKPMYCRRSVVPGGQAAAMPEL